MRWHHWNPTGRQRSAKRLPRILGIALVLAFVALVPIMRWAGGLAWPAALGAAAAATLALGAFVAGLVALESAADRLLGALARVLGIDAGHPAPRMTADERARRLAVMAGLLDAIEAELRRLEWWADPAPPLAERYARGELRTWLDAPSFELWLQCVFLPHARAAVAADALPPSSSVGVMAMRQYDYHGHVPEAQHLASLLSRFDAEANALVGHDPLAA